MTKNWLYPLSRALRNREQRNQFGYRSRAQGRQIVLPDTCYGCFVHMVADGWSGGDWYVSANGKNVEPGDRIWMYYGQSDGDRGLVGVGTVNEGYVRRNGTWAIVFTIDRAGTKLLCEHPYPARKVREHLPFPRNAVMALDKYPRLISAADHHLDKLA